MRPPAPIILAEILRGPGQRPGPDLAGGADGC